MKQILLFTLIFVLLSSAALALDWEDFKIDFETKLVNNGEILATPLSLAQVDENNQVTLQFQIAFGDVANGEVAFLDQNGEFARESITISPQETGMSTGQITYQLPPAPGTYFIAVKLGETLPFETFFYHVIEEPITTLPPDTGVVPPIDPGQDGDKSFDPITDIPGEIPEDTKVPILNPDDGSSPDVFTIIDDIQIISPGYRRRTPQPIIIPKEVIGNLNLRILKQPGTLMVLNPTIPISPAVTQINYFAFLRTQVDATTSLSGFSFPTSITFSPTGPVTLGLGIFERIWNWWWGIEPASKIKPTNQECCCGAGTTQSEIVYCSSDYEDCASCCSANLPDSTALPMSKCTGTSFSSPED